MAISVKCAACSAGFHVADEVAGKLVRCPECSDPVRVSSGSSSGSAEIVKQQPVKRSASSQSMRAASSGNSRAGRRSRSEMPAQRPAPAARPRPQAPRPSATESLARRKRSSRSPRKTKKDFPVGAAVAIGVSMASILICIAIVVLNRTPPEDLLVADDQEFTPPPEIGQGPGSVNLTASDQPTTGNQLASPTVSPQPTDFATENPGYNPAAQVASNRPAMTSVPSNSEPTPDTSGSSSNSAEASPSTDSSMAAADSAGNSSGETTSSESARPPVLPSWSDVNQLVGPSVVRVNMRTAEGRGNGSGFVIDAEKGVIVTNYHVVEGSFEINVAFENGDRIDVDGFLYLDHKRDIALIKFDPSKSSQSNLKALPIADAHPLKGEDVAAFGAPIGLDFSMTQDIVSAIRPASAMEKMLGMPDAKGTWIQHGVPISPGNSGGPLVNKRGEVVGINTMHLVAGQNLNFAISGLDVSDAFESQLDQMLAINPASAPVMTARATGGAGGSMDDPYERPDIPVVDVSTEDRGKKLLAKMKSLSILSIAFSVDQRGTVRGAVRSEARKAMDRCDVKLTSSRSAEYVMLMVMNLEPQGRKHVLRMNCQILSMDEQARQVLKIWEMTDDVGTISTQSIYQGYLPPVLQGNIKKYFLKVRQEILAARREFPAGGDEDEK